MKNYLFALALALFGVSCNIRPTTYTTAAGTRVDTLGGSFMSKSDSETASITKPDGTILSYTRDHGDETVVPNNYLKGKVLTSAIAGNVSTTNHATAAAARATGSKGAVVAPAVGGALIGAGAMALSSPSTPAQQTIPLPVMQARKPERDSPP